MQIASLVGTWIDPTQWQDFLAHLHGHWVAVLPELFVVGIAALLLVAEIPLKRENSRYLTLGALWLLAPVAMAIFASLQNSVAPQFVFVALDQIPGGEFAGTPITGPHIRSMMVVDTLAVVGKFAILLGTAMAVFLFAMARYLGKYRHGDFCALVYAHLFGLFVLVSATHWIAIWLAVEITTLVSSLLVGFRRETASIAAAQTRHVTGLIGSGCMIFGISLLYGATGTLYLADIAHPLPMQADVTVLAKTVAGVLIVAGMATKLLAAPLHQWASAAAESAPVPVAALVIVTSIVAGITVLIRVTLSVIGQPLAGLGVGIMAEVPWAYIFGVAAIVTMGLATYAALNERRVSRILAWLAVAHAGFLLGGMAGAVGQTAPNPAERFAAIGLHGWAFLFSTMAAFSALAIHLGRDGRDTIRGLNGLAHKLPVVAVVMAGAILSLIGVPPLAGFFGKFALLGTCMEVWALGPATWHGLFFAGVALATTITTIASVVVGFRVIRAMYWKETRLPWRHTLIRLRPTLPECLILAFAGIPIALLGLFWADALAIAADILRPLVGT